jgi:hypothetical protein
MNGLLHGLRKSLTALKAENHPPGPTSYKKENGILLSAEATQQVIDELQRLYDLVDDLQIELGRNVKL